MKELELSNLAKLDLNLLTAFVAIDRSRSVTKAAKILGVSQPAMSHTLMRLRDALSDPLFVKTPKEMVPTTRATDLAPIINGILSQIDAGILKASSAFSPHEITRTFRIRTTDFVEALLTPNLLKIFSDAAPSASYATTSTEFQLPRAELEQGRCDLAIGGFFGELPDGFYRQALFQDHFQCAVNPRFAMELGLKSRDAELSLDAYCRAKHVLIAPGGALSGRVDQVLKAKKRQRQVVCGLGHFLTSAWVTSQSNVILTAPSRLLGICSSHFVFKVFHLPVSVPKFEVVQVWHGRNHNDPAHRWFRQLVHKVLAEGPAS